MTELRNAVPRILYIAGYGRSGSTFLCRLLGQQPEICAAGELSRYLEWVDSSRPCSCGEEIRSCPLWKHVQLDMSVIAQGSRLWQAAIDSMVTLVLGLSWISKRQLAIYRTRHRRLFESIASAGNASIVVDSSKSDYGSAGRARALAIVAGLDVRVLHLIRNPHAVAESLMLGTNKELEGRSQGGRKFKRLRAFVGWTASNAAALLLARNYFPARTLRVHYEDLVSNPDVVLDRIARFAGISMERSRSVLSGEISARVQHLAEGNRMRLRTLELAPATFPSTTRLQRILCGLICGPVCHAVGMPVGGGVVADPERQSM